MGVPPFEPWQDEHRIDVLLNNPAVRSRLDRATQSSARRGSARQFIQQGLMASAAQRGDVDFFVGAMLQQWVRDNSPYSVKRAGSMSYPQPVGQVAAALLCVLARKAYPIQRITQREDGCFVVAVLPAGWLSLDGVLACTVTRRPRGADIHIATTIRGSLLDWGRSTKVISAILDEVRRDAAST